MADQGAKVAEFSQKIIELAGTKPNGLTNEDIIKGVPGISNELMVTSINSLMKSHQIVLYQQGKAFLYKLKDNTKPDPLRGADNEEKVVYTIIEEGGNKGVWIRDIRLKSNLILTQLKKILKSLESKNLIKAVKSVNASKKKVYMLFNLEPDRSVTGGAWYQDHDFDFEFVDVLNQQCLVFLQKKRKLAIESMSGPLAIRNASLCRVKEVLKYISDLGIFNVKLDEDDLETILKTIVYDGKAEVSIQMDGSRCYRATESPLDPIGLVQVPCGICTVSKNCSTIGEVTPKLCQYLTDWLE